MENKTSSSNFIKNIVAEDLKAGKVQEVITRFPPEPNGYLHIGHAKSICLNFELADEFKGKTNLRFDDTNPVKEDMEYVEAIKDDVKWLGFEWDDVLCIGLFREMYERAVLLIRKGKAFVCDLTAEQIRETRGTLTEPGQTALTVTAAGGESGPVRTHACRRVRGRRKVLRAKIDMSSPNINLRDPILYRIAHAIIIGRAMHGASTRCTIMRIRSAMRSKV